MLQNHDEIQYDYFYHMSFADRSLGPNWLRLISFLPLSLIDVGGCDIPEETIKSTKQNIQLLQVNEFTEVKTIQCKVEIRRTVYYCGMHSHVSIVRNGANEYIQDTNERTCEEMHRFGSLKIGFAQEIHGLRLNATKLQDP